ncbi:MAG: hypothetical protein RIB84_19160 [Sneathiellaceae bacterium]
MHHKRSKPKTQSKAKRSIFRGSRTGEAPGHFIRLYATRPARRRTKRALQAADDHDALVLPPGNRRPHPWFW